jgi:hypothetical protein
VIAVLVAVLAVVAAAVFLWLIWAAVDPLIADSRIKLGVRALFLLAFLACLLLAFRYYGFPAL